MNWGKRCLAIKIEIIKENIKTYDKNLRNQGTTIAFWIYAACILEIYTNNLNKKNCMMELKSPNLLCGQLLKHWVYFFYKKLKWILVLWRQECTVDCYCISIFDKLCVISDLFKELIILYYFFIVLTRFKFYQILLEEALIIIP